MGTSRSPRFHLPEQELSWRFSRSSGPGGQHVNTTDTRVELSWSIQDSSAVTAEQKDVLLARLRHRITGGSVVVVASNYRSQHRNRESARVRLEELVARALVPPKSRRATQPSRAAQQRRLEAKKRRGELKRSRRPDWD